MAEKIKLSDVFGKQLTQEDVIAKIKNCEECYERFCKLMPSIREQLLMFLMGKAGLRVSYNRPFKYVFNPEINPERLEVLLSLILNQPVVIKQVLPHEGEQLAEHGSIVIMDIIVELFDGSIVNVEMQKIGYEFPAQRSNCYISDMVMRQYNRARNMSEGKFSYNNLKPVYLIVLLENSPKEFWANPNVYIHRRNISYSSGIQLPELENIVYISLDMFRAIVQNVNTELEAWLTFLSSTEPDRILDLVQKYPVFLELYKELAVFRTNPKELIFMYFSEALYIMDRNMELYMIEEQKKALEEAEQVIAEKDQLLADKDQLLAGKDLLLADKDLLLADKERMIEELLQKVAKYEEPQ